LLTRIVLRRLYHLGQFRVQYKRLTDRSINRSIDHSFIHSFIRPFIHCLTYWSNNQSFINEFKEGSSRTRLIAGSNKREGPGVTMDTMVIEQ